VREPTTYQTNLRHAVVRFKHASPLRSERTEDAKGSVVLETV
jgi:hypothetical protein